jgi:hypothetical protein
MKKVIYKNDFLTVYELTNDPNFIYFNDEKIPYEDWLNMKNISGKWEKIYNSSPSEIVADAIKKINDRKSIKESIPKDNQILNSLLNIFQSSSFGDVNSSTESQLRNFIKTLPKSKQNGCLEEVERLFNN